VNRLLLMMNFCTFKNISVFRVFVKSVEPNNNKSVFKLIGKLMMWIYLSLIALLTTTYTCSVMRNIKSNRSVQINKSNLQPQTNTKPIYYYIGTRLGQILHARLRMQCRSLNHHLFHKKHCKFPILSMWGNRNHGPFSFSIGLGLKIWFIYLNRSVWFNISHYTACICGCQYHDVSFRLRSFVCVVYVCVKYMVNINKTCYKYI
jgi:hypothetical protein